MKENSKATSAAASLMPIVGCRITGTCCCCSTTRGNPEERAGARHQAELNRHRGHVKHEKPCDRAGVTVCFLVHIKIKIKKKKGIAAPLARERSIPSASITEHHALLSKICSSNPTEQIFHTSTFLHVNKLEGLI